MGARVNDLGIFAQLTSPASECVLRRIDRLLCPGMPSRARSRWVDRYQVPPRTGRNTGHLTTASEDTMYQRILVPVDGSSTSSHGLGEAIRLARLTQGRLRLIHVIDELSFALAMDAYSGQRGDWLYELRAAGT